ncbi:DUF1501 domain-containing protein [Cyclobacterium xiamenense]|uniref:DUF1501 domain-containing protein n=1 Tax=Cyclobacterium xiamenense TaxID=1297121 RepID=UPI0012B79DD7|nr:DUF1501 domain-containing protein [Cyclobacterium xiamenense]
MDTLKKLLAEKLERELQTQTRRHFIQRCVSGMGGLALGSLIGGCQAPEPRRMQLSERDLNPLSAMAPPFTPKVQSVIYLHMAGAPSQLEMFDYKPELARLHNKECPESLLQGRKFAFIRGRPNLLGPQANFEQCGESGNWVSDYLPHFKQVVDEVAFLKAVHTDQFNHGPAQLFMQTGSPRLGRPSIGSWVTYGLGSENQNLPGFVVLTSGGKTPDAGKSVWGSGFLPSVYQGVQCRSQGDPVLYIEDPKGMSRSLKRKMLDAINGINEADFQAYADPEILARINQYEMAFRMQIEVPEVMNINEEPEYIHQLYGTQPGEESFANNCLLARKMVEKGVRFVQLYDWGWDAHGTGESTAIDLGMKDKCREIDRPITALLTDLKQRGLLDQTLVVWGGEFGRTPMQENREGKTQSYKGRDHHVDAFTMWMAGGGIKKGAAHGLTDEFGFSGVEDTVSVHDIHATILQLLGFDHEQFTFDFQGRPFRLTDVEGHVIREILS